MIDKTYFDMITFAADVLKEANAEDNFDAQFGAAMMIAYQFDLSGEMKKVHQDIRDAMNSTYQGLAN